MYKIEYDEFCKLWFIKISEKERVEFLSRENLICWIQMQEAKKKTRSNVWNWLN